MNKLAHELDLSIEAIKLDFAQIVRHNNNKVIQQNKKVTYNKEHKQQIKSDNKINKSDLEAERIILWSLINNPESRVIIQELDGTSFIEPNHVLLAAELFKYADCKQTLTVRHLLDVFYEQKDICYLLTKLEFEMSELKQDMPDVQQVQIAINAIKKRQAKTELNTLKKQLTHISSEHKQSDKVDHLIKAIQSTQKKINQLS